MFLVLLALHVAGQGLHVTYNAETRVYNAPYFDPGLNQFDVTAPLVDALDNCCRPERCTDVAGSLALIDSGGCSFETKARNCQAAGCTGGIVPDYARLTFGFNMYAVYDGTKTDDIIVPLQALQPGDFSTLRQELSDLNARKESGAANQTDQYIAHAQPQSNPWEAVMRSTALQSVTKGPLFAMQLWSVAYSAYKILQFIKAEAWGTIGFVCLLLHLSASIYRSVYLMFDPFFSLRLWPSYRSARVALTASFSTTILSSLLMAYVWAEMLYGLRRQSNATLLVVFKLFAYCICPITLIVDVCANWFGVSDGDGVKGASLTGFLMIYYVILEFISLAVYMYFGREIVKILEKSETMKMKKAHQANSKETLAVIERMRRLLYLSAGGMAFFIFSSVLFLILLREGPIAFVTIGGFVYTSLFLTTAPQILSFRPPETTAPKRPSNIDLTDRRSQDATGQRIRAESAQMAKLNTGNSKRVGGRSLMANRQSPASPSGPLSPAVTSGVVDNANPLSENNNDEPEPSQGDSKKSPDRSMRRESRSGTTTVIMHRLSAMGTHRKGKSVYMWNIDEEVSRGLEEVEMSVTATVNKSQQQKNRRFSKATESALNEGGGPGSPLGAVTSILSRQQPRPSNELQGAGTEKASRQQLAARNKSKESKDSFEGEAEGAAAMPPGLPVLNTNVSAYNQSSIALNTPTATSVALGSPTSSGGTSSNSGIGIGLGNGNGTSGNAGNAGNGNGNGNGSGISTGTGHPSSPVLPNNELLASPKRTFVINNFQGLIGIDVHVEEEIDEGLIAPQMRKQPIARKANSPTNGEGGHFNFSSTATDVEDGTEKDRQSQQLKKTGARGVGGAPPSSPTSGDRESLTSAEAGLASKSTASGPATSYSKPQEISRMNSRPMLLEKAEKQIRRHISRTSPTNSKEDVDLVIQS